MAYSTENHLRTSSLHIAAAMAYAEQMRHPQHDAHVIARITFRAAYGDQAGYLKAMADKARSDARHMLTADGRAFLARRNASHAEYRASRAGLPF